MAVTSAPVVAVVNISVLAGRLKSVKPTRPIGDSQFTTDETYSEYATANAQWETEVDAIADVLKESNPEFDLTLFYSSCGRNRVCSMCRPGWPCPDCHVGRDH